MDEVILSISPKNLISQNGMIRYFAILCIQYTKYLFLHTWKIKTGNSVWPFNFLWAYTMCHVELLSLDRGLNSRGSNVVEYVVKLCCSYFATSPYMPSRHPAPTYPTLGTLCNTVEPFEISFRIYHFRRKCISVNIIVNSIPRQFFVPLLGKKLSMLNH